MGYPTRQHLLLPAKAEHSLRSPFRWRQKPWSFSTIHCLKPPKQFPLNHMDTNSYGKPQLFPTNLQPVPIPKRPAPAFPPVRNDVAAAAVDLPPPEPAVQVVKSTFLWVLQKIIICWNLLLFNKKNREKNGESAFVLSQSNGHTIIKSQLLVGVDTWPTMSSWPSPRPKWSSRYPADLRTKWPGKQRSLGVEIHKIHWVQKKTLGGGFKKKHSGGSQQKNYYASLLLAFVNQSMKKWYEKKAPTIAIRPIKNMKMLALRSMTSKSWHHAASSKPQGSKPWYWCAGRPQTRGKYGSWQMALLGLLVKGCVFTPKAIQNSIYDFEAKAIQSSKDSACCR